MSATAPRTLSVLLVEDSLADGRLLLEALRPAVTAGELLVQTVKRLSQAAEELQRFDYSCVLLDLGLPDGQGVENVSALRAVDHRPAIIVLTGLDDERVAVEALKLGAQDYLLKGETDAEQLLRLIRRSIQRNRQTVQLEHQRDSAYLAATREPLTLLPNLPLLLELARQQQAELRGQRSLLLGVLVLDGLQDFRERAGTALADAWLRDAAQALSEQLRPADTLACVAPGCFVLLPRPAVDAQALQTLLAPLVHALERQQSLRSSTLRWRLAHCQLQEGQQGIEQLLNEALDRAIAPQMPGSVSATTASAAAAQGVWRPWVDTQSARCAGAFWAGPLQADAPIDTVLSAWAATSRALQASSAAGTEPLALTLPSRFWSTTATPGVAALKGALAAESMTFHQLAVVLPQAALSGSAEIVSELQAAGVQLLLDTDPIQLPDLPTLAQWPLQALLLPAAQWQRVLDDNLRGPSRRALDALLGACHGLGARVIATGVDDANARDALRLIGLRWMQGAALLSTLDGAALCAQWSASVELPR